ncbi:AMP-binding protein [Opitutus sp. GAS368]|jgi:acyl-[acyl-carrier-protein]-phospholipid O-acyltransferase/long-chain-fatty-acid--[acyl-carrier-protein] ligase|uniref:AMP-binding protein n=1 Tax=Opitutus sp. GAS368 TaxID=1882749 RepID=UPI00087C688C|nr:AMP-binding protein [Opitutus sp. GAS368]SDR65553.1 acyl-[acyl-carrier-protein]-phospholipid O-acyltransferase / long-chain-fatty-acid--[acyl-carrier-protein] ligase [Opitutus sp. GAS368]
MKSPHVPLTARPLPPASLVAELWRDSPLRRTTYGIMFFFGLGAYLGLFLLRWNLGLWLAGAGVGVVLGAGAAGLVSRRGPELGLVPLGGIVLIAALATLGRDGHDLAFAWWFGVAGFGCGLFLVPLFSYVRGNAGGAVRALVALAIPALGAVAVGAALYCLLATPAGLNWQPFRQFRLLAGLTLFMTLFALYHLPHQTVCAVMRLIGALFYRVKALGTVNVPAGGALVLCNHLSYVDAVVLQIASPRPLRFVAFAGFAKSPVVRYLFRAAGVIPVNPNKPLKGIRLAWDALQAGELVCVFPEGAISRTGQLMELRRGFETIVQHAKVPVVPAAIDGLWGSVYSFAGNRYLWKSPRLMPTHVCVVFGPPIPSEKADVAHMRKAMLDVGEEAFQERPMLKRHLGREIVRSLAKRPRHIELVDRTAERRAVSAAQLLAVAATLSRYLRKTVPGKRIGIVLPPGAGAHIANLAVAFADKVPVNLNFTAGRTAIEASLKLGEIDTVITADAMRAKVPNFPFPANTLDLKQAIEAAGGKIAILPWLLAAWLLPNQWVANLLGLPKQGDNEEAALLFTSGSSGEPKGVVLTHRNLFANCAQISSLSILPDTAVLMACLPVFHSFGFTVTLWYPLLRGCMVVTVPSPLDTKKIIEAIQQEQATVMLGAPTFVRPFLKKASKEELKSLTLVVTGAEKLTMDLYEAFLGQFGIEILQGYGLTETTPATNINQHNPPITTSTAAEQLGKRKGAVGRLMPGMTARIVDPDTGEELPMTSTGMLWLRGANVFPGYLKDPEKTATALKDGWFITGDLGRFDHDGFLFIEGRLSRFSKIGGEMVPHGTIEQRILDLFGWDQHDGPVAAITGIPDSSKGEALVLLTTQDITLEQLRSKLLESGLPNLWVPKILRKVDRIPMLGTGKTDLKGVRTLAIELTKETAEA